MNKAIPENLRASAALKFVVEQGWNWEVAASGDQIQVENCPYCHKGGSKFYIGVCDPKVSTRDGLHFCHHGSCGKQGNLRTLQEHLGIRIAGVDSRKEWAGSGEKPDTLPDVEACHAALLGEAETMDYLLNVRGFSKEIIEKQKLGFKEKVWFREAGESKALVIPYLVGGNVVFAKFRTLPPKPKDFVTPSGWEAPLYNGEILQEGIQEVIFVEGETNTISLMNYGINNVVGVPGCNVKKAAWIETLDKLSPKIYILYDNDKAGKKSAQEIASRIGIEKCWRMMLPPFDVTVPEDQCKLCDKHGVTVNRKYDAEGRISNPRECPHVRPGKDANEWFRYGGGTVEAFEKLKDEAGLFDVTGVTSSGDALTQLMDELDGKTDLSPSYVFPWPELNKMIGMEDGDILDILAPEKIGKAGRLSSLIKTVTGWKRNGDLKVGDELASTDGEPSFVTGVYPQGVLEMFKVTFSDGRSTEVSAEHLWKVCHVNTPDEWHVYTTDAIMSEYGRNQTGNGQRSGNLNKQLYIPFVSGDFGADNDLPIEPWLLGVLIGDGGITNGTPTITNTDSELLVRLTSVCSGYGLTLNRTEADSASYRMSALPSGGTKENPITKALRQLELWGHRAEDKFIPAAYLNASKKSRWELLRGLMDTDGTAGNKHGTASYTSVSVQLALDVQHLVRSLGGASRIGPPTKKSFRYKGELRTGQPAYIVSVLMPERESLFYLSRKLARVKRRSYQPRLTFTHIESIGKHEAQCISVSHSSKLYITDDYIVTHNTTFGLNIMDYMVAQYEEPGLLVCLEMTQARLARKHVALVTGFEDKLTEPDSEESKLKLAELKGCCIKAQSILQSRDADLYFAYPQMVKEPEDIFKLMRDCIRRYGVKWIMFDNVQRLCDDTLKNQAHRTVQLSQISKGLAKLTKDYRVKMIRILQPNKGERGGTVSSGDVDGSSQIAKDCDGMITLWRAVVGEQKKSEWQTQQEGFEETYESFSPVMRVAVALSRYSAGGTTKLFYDGARSQVRSLPESQKAPPQRNFNGIIVEGGEVQQVIPTETGTTIIPTEEVQI
jgi:replicative DNA helicase